MMNLHIRKNYTYRFLYAKVYVRIRIRAYGEPIDRSIDRSICVRTYKVHVYKVLYVRILICLSLRKSIKVAEIAEIAEIAETADFFNSFIFRIHSFILSKSQFLSKILTRNVITSN